MLDSAVEGVVERDRETGVGLEASRGETRRRARRARPVDRQSRPVDRIDPDRADRGADAGIPPRPTGDADCSEISADLGARRRSRTTVCDRCSRRTWNLGEARSGSLVVVVRGRRVVVVRGRGVVVVGRANFLVLNQGFGMHGRRETGEGNAAFERFQGQGETASRV